MPAETPAQPRQLADELERLHAEMTPMGPMNWRARRFEGTTDTIVVSPEMTFGEWEKICALRHRLPEIVGALRAADAAPTPTAATERKARPWRDLSQEERRQVQMEHAVPYCGYEAWDWLALGGDAWRRVARAPAAVGGGGGGRGKGRHE